MKPILFIDFEGTLCFDRFWRSLPADMFVQTQEVLFGGNATYAEKWMRGEYTSEEVNEYLATKLDIEPGRLWELFVADAKTMKVSRETLNQISSLRNRYTTILLTVNMDSFSRFTVPSLSLHSYFDYISNSYDEGLFKTENNGEIFKKYLNKYSAPVKESIIIDDSESACATFTALGGRALRVLGEQTVDVHLKSLV